MTLRILGAPALLLPLALPFSLAAAPAVAHVSAEPAEAPAGAYQVIRFRVGHGCAGRATTALRVEIPAGLGEPRPQPKPGWDLKIARTAAPDRVSAITWTGSLPADQFDDFAILARLPDTPGPLYFPAVQTCGAEDARWSGVPDPGEDAHALSHPAPVVRIVPASGPAEMHHH